MLCLWLCLLLNIPHFLILLSFQKTTHASQGFHNGTTWTDDNFGPVILEVHNKVRRLHGLTELSWNNVTEDASQAWCDKLAETGLFKHNPHTLFGENLAKLSTTSRMLNITKISENFVEVWYEEIRYWNFETSAKQEGHESKKTGHFTQLVWRNTSSVGCSYATGNTTVGNRNILVVCCNYDPPGNWKREYAENVPPNIGCFSDNKIFCPADRTCRLDHEQQCPCSWDEKIKGECKWFKTSQNQFQCGGKQRLFSCHCESCAGEKPADELNLCSPADCHVHFGEGFVLDISKTNNGYGTVLFRDEKNTFVICNDGFSDNEATVICKQLNYAYGTVINSNENLSAKKNTKFGITNLKCPMGSSNLQECSYMIYNEISVPCYPGEEAAVSCSNDVISLNIINFKYNLKTLPRIVCTSKLMKYNKIIETDIVDTRIFLQNRENKTNFQELDSDQARKLSKKEIRKWKLLSTSCLVCVVRYYNITKFKYNFVCKQKKKVDNVLELIHLKN